VHANYHQVGAGLQLTPNSSRLLQKWQLGDGFWDKVAEPPHLTVRRYSGGKFLPREEDFDNKMRSNYGSPFADVHRVDLQLALVDRAQELGVTFHLGQMVVNINFELAEIATDSGLKRRVDLVVAADGLWSQCRKLFLGTDDPPRPTGDLAYRVVLQLSSI
jgi:salicylate hydroxylase